MAADKTRIVDELGEKALLLPRLLNQALAANERAKYLMTLLQTARHHADHPELKVSDLQQERLTCGISTDTFDNTVERSRKEAPESYCIPECRRIHELLTASIREMLAPLDLERSTHVGTGNGVAYEERLRALLANTPSLADDCISGDYIDRLASVERQTRDSLHLLVMDLHKELNRLQAEIASETIDGACVYGIEESDRPLIGAFMAGVNETKGLKFDHPGLGTTATRAGNELVLQNDIGTTDAHVLVVHVAPPRVTLTHTDVHLQRLLFFQSLFDRFSVTWDDTRSRRAPGLEDEVYHLCQGTYVARDSAGLETYLRFLGSRLVFLIDWNRARKCLRKVATKGVCVDVLRWAADHNYGHRAFLQLGGERLIFDALQIWGKALQVGGRLADVLGPDKVGELLKFTLKTAAEGLLQDRSELLVHDEISAELRHYLDTAHHELLEIAAEHAALIVELAMAARDSLLMTSPLDDRDYLRRTAARAKTWEHRADELVKRGRAARRGAADAGSVPELVGFADDAADELEEAVFLLTLLPGGDSVSPPFLPLHDLADLLVQAAQEHLKAVENARQLQRGSSRQQVQDFLEAVDRTFTIEHQTDDAHRRSQSSILTFAGDFKQLHLFAKIADNLEEAADALLRSVLRLRDYVLGGVLTR